MAENDVRKLPCEDPANYTKGWLRPVMEVFKHLPAWYYIFYGMAVTTAAMIWYNPSRTIALCTFGFPLLWFLVYYYARYSKKQPSVKVLRPLSLLLVFFGGFLIAVNLLLGPIWPEDVIVPIKKYLPEASVSLDATANDDPGAKLLETGDEVTIYPDQSYEISRNKKLMYQSAEAITGPEAALRLPSKTSVAPPSATKLLYKVEGMNLVNRDRKDVVIYSYEISKVIVTILLIFHCFYYRGKTGLLKFFGAALLYGFFIETAGVLLDYFRENDYHVYLPLFAAPMATMAGWSTIFYASISIFEMFEKRWAYVSRINVFAAGAIISLIALFWDLHLDPIATGVGMWTWHEFLPEWYLGVPFINFSSWFSAVFTFGVGYTYIHRRHDWSEKKKVVAMFVMIPIVESAAGLINFPVNILIEGTDGPVMQILSLYFEGLASTLL